MKNLNWLAECAIENGKTPYAIQRLRSVIATMNEGTRIWVEARALLSICELRQGSYSQAKLHITETLNHVKNIKTEYRRKQFYNRFVTRVEEECILAGMKGNLTQINVDEVQERAVELIKLNNDENSLTLQLGTSLPAKSISLLEGFQSHTQKLLPYNEKRLCAYRDKACNAPQAYGIL
jgi:hypothetical protein